MPDVRELVFEVPVVPRRSAEPSIRSFEPLPTHDLLMEAVLRYRLLTNEQLTRLFYKPGMFTTVQTRTGALANAGYFLVVHLPSGSQRGGAAKAVFTLARKGINRMAQFGHRVPTRYNPGEIKRWSPEYIRTKLAENDVLIVLERLCTEYPQIERLHPPERFRAPGLALHEWNLKRHPSSVTITVGAGDHRRTKRRAVVPDGWVHLSVTPDNPAASGSALSGYNQAIAFEVDRHTEEQDAFREKVRALVAWLEGPYREDFAAESLVIAVVAVPGRNKTRADAGVRAQQLRAWTESELAQLVHDGDTRLALEELTQLFLFTDAEPADEPPAALFLAPRWQEPFGDRRIPLLEDIDASDL